MPLQLIVGQQPLSPRRRKRWRGGQGEATCADNKQVPSPPEERQEQGGEEVSEEEVEQMLQPSDEEEH